MATLLIDTSDGEKISVALKIDGRNFQLTRASRTLRSQALLPLLEEQLRKHQLRPTDIKEIKVNPGPGSFTGLRVGVAVANALGWALGIPVNGKRVDKQPVEPLYL